MKRINRLMRKPSPEDRILQILQAAKLKDRDWEEIRNERKSC